MPTSSFGKTFELRPEKVDEFLMEMNREIPPTLPKDFKSKLVSGKEAKAFFEKVGKALD